MMPPNSCSVPGRKPGTFSKVTSGMLKITGQRHGAFLNARAPGIVQADHRRGGLRRPSLRSRDDVPPVFGDDHSELSDLAAKPGPDPVSYTHLRAHETDASLVCRL